MYKRIKIFQIKISQVCLDLHANFVFNIKLLGNHPVDLKNNIDFVCFYIRCKESNESYLLAHGTVLSLVCARNFSCFIIFSHHLRCIFIYIRIHIHTRMLLYTGDHSNSVQGSVIFFYVLVYTLLILVKISRSSMSAYILLQMSYP